MGLRRGLLFFLLLMCCGPVAGAQSPALDTVVVTRGYLHSYAGDTRELLLFPRHWQKGDTRFAIGGAMLIGASFFLDEQLERSLRSNQWRKDLPDQALKYGIEPWGAGAFPALVAAGCFTLGALRQQPELRYNGLFQFKTVLLAAAASRIPKFLLQRHRPAQEGIHPFRFDGPFNGFSGSYSFPSGHAFISFSWAAATAASFEGKRGLKAAMFMLAAAVSASRVATGEHWLSDVTAGAVMGYAFGRLSWRIQSRYQEQSFLRRKKQ